MSEPTNGATQNRRSLHATLHGGDRTVGLLVIGFVSGTFFGIFVIALAQAAGADARAPKPQSKVRSAPATLDVEDDAVVLDAESYATAATGSFRRHTG